MRTDGTETELSEVVLLLSSEYSKRWSETLLSPCSCVSCVEDSADNVRTKAGVDGRSVSAVILGASVMGASVAGASVVVQVGNTGGTGTTSSEAGNVSFAVELFFVARVEYAYSKMYVFWMVDLIGPFRGLLELYLGGPMIEQRVVVESRNAEGI